MDLFAHASEREAAARGPLAERMRPTSLDQLVGQEHLTGLGRLLRRAVEGGALPSTTAQATSTTRSSPPSSSRCAARIPTRRSTG